MDSIVSTSPPPSPNPGDEWMDAHGRQFVWALNTDGHGQWVQIPLQRSAGDIPTVTDAPVVTNPAPKVTSAPLPPLAPNPNDLWFDTKTGFFFIWYWDGNTYQWVVTNPGRGSAVVPPASVVPVVINSDPGIILTPDPLIGVGSIGADPAWLDGHYLPITGGTMTGDLLVDSPAGAQVHLGNAWIDLMATTGGPGIDWQTFSASVDQKNWQMYPDSGTANALLLAAASDGWTNLSTWAFHRDGTTSFPNKVGIGTTGPLTFLDVHANVNGAVSMGWFVNDSTGASSRSTIVQEAGGRAVFRNVDRSGQYLHEVGQNIPIRYSDFDTHYFRNTAGFAQLTIAPAGATLTTPLTGTTGQFASVGIGGSTIVPFSTYGGTSNVTPLAQISSAAIPGLSLQRYSAGTNGPVVNLSNSGSVTLGGQGLVPATAVLGGLSFNGSDGAKFIEGAYIHAEVDATPGLNDMPTRLTFGVTRDGAAVPVEAMRISNTGAVALTSAVPATPATDAFSMSVANPGGNTGNIFRLRAGAAGTTDQFKVDMTGDGAFSGSIQAFALNAPPAGGGNAFGMFLGNFSGGNLGVYFGAGNPTVNCFGKKGSIYLDTTGAVPWYNVDGGTTWAQLGGGGASISVGITPPGSPTAGALWWNSELGQMFIYYNDGNTSQWVPASPGGNVQAIPPGSVMDFAGDTAPNGWLFANGAVVSRTAFPGLFSAIGTKYGVGDGSSTFGLPDYGGRVSVGREAVATRLTVAISGIDSTVVGAVGGDQSMQSHNHTAAVGNSGAVNTGRYGYGDGNNIVNVPVNSAGAGNSQNVQPTIIMNKIIKT